MKRFRLVGLALVAVFALGAVLSTTAFALPEFLPLTNNKTFTGKSTAEPILETASGTTVSCKKASGTGGLETDTLGSFHITFEECKESVFKASCTSSGDASGQILTLGSLHFVYDTLGSGEGLGVAILFLPGITKFECAGGLAKNEVKGNVICLILKPLTVSVTHEFHCLKGANKGEQAETHYWNDNGTIVTAELLSSLNGGTFEKSNEQALSTITTPLEGSWMNE